VTLLTDRVEVLPQIHGYNAMLVVGHVSGGFIGAADKYNE